MKKYSLFLLMSCMMTSCSAHFFETQRKKLIDIMDEAQKQVQNVTCKIRDAIIPVDKKSSPFKDSEKLLLSIQKGLKDLRIVVIDALEKNSFNVKLLSDSLGTLTADVEKLSLLEKLDQDSREKLKELSDTIVLTYQALFEETGVLDLWVHGYDAYMHDLEDNFKNLPNTVIQKPDFKRLYEELGLSTEQGKKASFTTIQESYKTRFDALKEQYSEEFETTCFRPYLRVLQYVFRTVYSKKQYEAWLLGKEVYDEKGSELKDYKSSIQKLFGEDLPALRIITGTLQAEFC